MIRALQYCRNVAVLLIIWSVAIPMGEQTPQSTLKEPAFAPLEEGAGNFSGRIKDENTITELSQISFFGRTDVGGVRREDDDSVTKLDLSHIKSIRLIDHVFASVRYPEKDFAAIDKTALDGTITKGLLLPRHIIVCGVEKKTGDQKAWYLSKIDELIVDHDDEQEAPSEKAFEKILKKADGAMPTLKHKSQAAQVTQEGASLSQDVMHVTEKYKEKEVKIVDKQAETVALNKTITQAFTDVLGAIVDLIKTLFGFIKNLFW